MIFSKKILQKKANEKSNLTRKDLVNYFKKHHESGINDGVFMDADDMADECIELTKDTNDDVPMCEPEFFDPTHNPTLNGFFYSNLVRNGDKFGDERLKQISGQEIKVNYSEEKKEKLKPIRKKIMDDDFYKNSDPLSQPIKEPRY